MVNFKFFKPLVLLAFLIPIHARTKTAQKIFPMISESPVHSFTITLRQSYVDPSLGKWPIKRTPAEAILVEYNSNVLLLPPHHVLYLAGSRRSYIRRQGRWYLRICTKDSVWHKSSTITSFRSREISVADTPRRNSI